MRVNVVKHRLLSFLLCVTVMASTIAGAMIVSFDFAKAAVSDELYFDDLYSILDNLNIVPHSDLVSFLDYVDLYLDSDDDTNDNKFVVIENSGSNWIICVWAFKSTLSAPFTIYSKGGSNSGIKYSYTGTDPNPYSVFTLLHRLYIHDGSYSLTYNINSNKSCARSSEFSWPNNNDSWVFPSSYELNSSSNRLFINKSVVSGFTNGWTVSANLYQGSSVPPIIDFSFFKFNLGDRWFLTTNDQSWVNGMSQEDEYYNVWELNFFRSDGTFDDRYIESPAMVRLSYAQNFMTQTLTNVSSSGVLAYDITELINDETYLNVSSNFYRAFETPGGYSDLTWTGQSMDIVDLVLSPQEEDPSINNAWTIINNYFENYPTITVMPQDLAAELSGNKATSTGTGYIQIPDQIYQWMNNGSSGHGLDTDFHYDLTVSGLDPDDPLNSSMINFDLFDVCIIPSLPSFDAVLEIGSFRMPVYYWKYTYENDDSGTYQFHPDLAYNCTYEDVWENYDLVFIMNSNSPWLLSPNYGFDLSNLTTFHRVAYQGPDLVRGGLDYYDTSHLYQGYWVLTKRALQKNQLFVFCDGFYKLYDMMEQYIQKRDLWDTSFFQWTSGLFWQIDSLDGKLGQIYDLMNNWKLSTQFELLFDKLDQIGNNMVEPDLSDVDPWYLPLWNWVNLFAPSVNDFSNSIEAMDDTFDELPAIPQVTDPPAIPTLPGFE